MNALPRVVANETLDGLAEDDPAAQRSRRDLRRVNAVMGSRRWLWRGMREAVAARRSTAPLRILELGAGDGSLLLGLARAHPTAWPAAHVTLLDRQSLIGLDTIEAFAAQGWTARVEVADVLAWAGRPADAEERWDLIVANLFMHHFEAEPLARLLDAIAVRSHAFVACEPRRSRLALAASHLVGALGANAVTREDAVLSVHAGFHDDEMSRLWPSASETRRVDAASGVQAADEWLLQEHRAGLFTHCFVARRRAPGLTAAPSAHQ